MNGPSRRPDRDASTRSHRGNGTPRLLDRLALDVHEEPGTADTDTVGVTGLGVTGEVVQRDAEVRDLLDPSARVSVPRLL